VQKSIPPLPPDESLTKPSAVASIILPGKELLGGNPHGSSSSARNPWAQLIVLGVVGLGLMLVFWPSRSVEVIPPLSTAFFILQDQPINNRSIREVYVRIQEPISEGQVKAIALNVKNSADLEYPKTRVWFLLPGQSKSGAWASATFRPELEVLIIGASADTHQVLGEAEYPSNGKRLGEWIWDVGLLTRKITLIERGARVFMIETFVGQKGDTAVDEKEIQVLGVNEYRFPGSAETWMTINRYGELEFRDREGKIDAARPVK